MPPRVKTVASISVEKFFDAHAESLGLELHGERIGFSRPISEPAMNRPGLALACVATAVLIARSSSAVLALSLGTIIYLAIFGRWGRWLLIAIVPLYFILGGILDSGLLPSDLRVVQLLKAFYEDPWYLITADTSANMRLGGIWVGLQESVERGFIPAGLDSAQWEAAVGPIMAKNPWLIALSPAGIASGLLIVVYQLGVLGLAE